MTYSTCYKLYAVLYINVLGRIKLTVQLCRYYDYYIYIYRI
jgi:hypothetical protein